MNIAVFQQEGRPLSEVSFAPGVDELLEAARVIPSGVPFWLVPQSEMVELYAQQGDWRDAWALSQDAIGREPDGVGEA